MKQSPRSWPTPRGTHTSSKSMGRSSGTWRRMDGPSVRNQRTPLDHSSRKKLDQSFFRVRAERTSELELQYLRHTAELGPGPHTTGAVADTMGRTSEQLGPTRARLIDKGLLYTPGHGLTAFTVPQFDRYMRSTKPRIRIWDQPYRECSLDRSQARDRQRTCPAPARPSAPDVGSIRPEAAVRARILPGGGPGARFAACGIGRPAARGGCSQP
jgi:hypothetical protein